MERAKITKIFNALKTLPTEKDYRILIRYETLEPVGLITKREFLNDSSIGRSRDWSKGLTFDGQTFREPLDMINPRTNELKSCIIRDNGFFVVTARVSDDAGNEDKNFHWFASPEQMALYPELMDQITMKDGVIGDQSEKIKTLTAEKILYQSETRRLGSHNNNLADQTGALAAEVSRLNTRHVLMESQVAYTAEMRTELAAHLLESLKSAGMRGKTRAMNYEEIVDEAFTKMADREEKMGDLPSKKGGADNSELILTKLTKMDERMTELETKSHTTTKIEEGGPTS